MEQNCYPFFTPEFPSVLSLDGVAQFLDCCVVYFVRRSLFVLFLFVIVLSVLFRFTAYVKTFGVDAVKNSD